MKNSSGGRIVAYANAIYDDEDGSFLFHTGSSTPKTSVKDIGFYCVADNLTKIFNSRPKNAKLIIPFLIDRVHVDLNHPGVDFELLALQHNAFVIKEFKKQGYNINLLPESALTPNLDYL